MNVTWDGVDKMSNSKSLTESSASSKAVSEGTKEITAPLEGKIFLTKDSGERAIKVGDQINTGDVVCYIEAMKVTNAVKSDVTGTVVEVLISEGDEVLDDDVLIRLA